MNKEVLKKAIDYFSSERQLVMIMEELAELSQQVSKYYRGKGDTQDLLDEIADVYIMLEQLKLMMPQINHDDIQATIDKKIKLLKGLMENE